MIAVRLSSPAMRRVFEGLPHRSLGELAVTGQDPDPVGQSIEALPGEGDADRDRQSLAKGPGGDVDPWQDRRRVTLEAAAVLPIREQRLVVDRSGGAIHRVEQRRRVALAEDEVVVVGDPGASKS